jgi:hypothetical protein
MAEMARMAAEVADKEQPLGPAALAAQTFFGRTAPIRQLLAHLVVVVAAATAARPRTLPMAAALAATGTHSQMLAHKALSSSRISRYFRHYQQQTPSTNLRPAAHTINRPGPFRSFQIRFRFRNQTRRRK